MSYKPMAKPSTENVGQKKPGRPATGHDRVRSIRLSDETVAKVDTWATAHGLTGLRARSEAIRRLLDKALS